MNETLPGDNPIPNPESKDSSPNQGDRSAVQNQPEKPTSEPGVTGIQTRTAADETNHFTQAENSSASAAISGRTLGEYELLEEIGRGGMGVVYKARQKRLNRLVAVKLIRSGELATEREVKRFKFEAESAAKLDHSGIVPVHDFSQHQGHWYLAMGLVTGKSLDARLNGRPLPSRDAAQLALAVAEAVEHAHQAGIVHRDIKPSNILIDESGRPKITDFGLAKQLDGEASLTASGQILGTPNYMSPEQANGQAAQVGPRSDVYSLGAVLYTMLTGAPPFRHANPLDVLLMVRDQPPAPPRNLNSNVDRDVEAICLKCLEKDPSARYGSMRELANDMRRYLTLQRTLC